jgi:hypothetical protein
VATPLIHVSAGGQKILAFFRRYFPFLAEKYGVRPARTGHHFRTFDAVFHSACARCAHQRQKTHQLTAAAQTTTAAAARRRRHRPRLLPLWQRQSCAGARCACRLNLLGSPVPQRCLCLCLCLWLWATAAAAPLPVEDREEEAPRAHLRAGTQPARGSNPGRALRLRESSEPAAGEENFAPRT